MHVAAALQLLDLMVAHGRKISLNACLAILAGARHLRSRILAQELFERMKKYHVCAAARRERKK